jgi:hypothetical protein
VSLALHRLLDGILAEAACGMFLEIAGRLMVLLVLISTNTPEFGFAEAGSTGEKVVLSTLVVFDSDCVLEEGVDWGGPGKLCCRCEVVSIGYELLQDEEPVPNAFWGSFSSSDSILMAVSSSSPSL